MKIFVVGHYTIEWDINQIYACFIPTPTKEKL